jgi:hypothetical protein
VKTADYFTHAMPTNEKLAVEQEMLAIANDLSQHFQPGDNLNELSTEQAQQFELAMEKMSAVCIGKDGAWRTLPESYVKGLRMLDEGIGKTMNGLSQVDEDLGGADGEFAKQLRDNAFINNVVLRIFNPISIGISTGTGLDRMSSPTQLQKDLIKKLSATYQSVVNGGKETKDGGTGTPSQKAGITDQAAAASFNLRMAELAQDFKKFQAATLGQEQQ